jgi:hypothetical protein
MTCVAWMATVSIGSWLALLAATGGAFAAELTAGMAAPLVAAAASWLVTVKTFATNPARVQPVMLHGFAAKLLFFCVYVVVMLRVVGLQPAPFVLTFTGYFLALYVMQAFQLKRLFLPGARSAA